MCNRDKSCSWRFGLNLKIWPGQTLLKINDPYMMEMMIRTQRMEPKKVPFVVPMILLNMDDPQR